MPKHNISGWRKLKDWRRDLKNKMRALGQASSSGGKGKQDRIKKSAQEYLTKAKSMRNKLEESKATFPQTDIADLIIFMELERFLTFLNKHINLLERRVIKEEKIPHTEKMFSIFEEYTEWITKGKMRPNVELGKKTTITTDQFNLIVHYKIMDHQSDSEIVPELSKELTTKYWIKSWSFDKGFWHKENKRLLLPHVDKLIMPKKGKLNNQERIEESEIRFKRLRNKHSAIESNINELESRGLNRCPDRGYDNFKRYIGLAISAFNLRKIGAELIAREIIRKQLEEEVLRAVD